MAKKIKNEFKKALKDKRIKAASNLGITLLEYEERFLEKSKKSKKAKQLNSRPPIVTSSSIDSAKKYHEKRAKRAKLAKKNRELKRKKLKLPKPKRSIWIVRG